MNNEHEPTYLICWPYLDAQQPHPEGSTIGLCYQCNLPIWISPSGQATIDRGARTICFHCDKPSTAFTENDITPATVAEVNQFLGTNYTRNQMLQWLRTHPIPRP